MALLKCPDCGKPVSDKAEKCVSCGCPISALLNPVTPETVSCSECKKDYLFEANNCPHCGCFNGKKRNLLRPLEEYKEKPVRVQQQKENSPNPGVAAALSFFIPGMGQIYKGKILIGMVWLFFTVGGYTALVVPGVIIHMACVFNAYKGKV